MFTTISSVFLCTMTTMPLFVLILGMWWLVYCEGEGMLCLLCRVHNTKNKYYKQDTFNLAPSTNYKHGAVSNQARASEHT